MHSGDEGAAGCEALLWTASEDGGADAAMRVEQAEVLCEAIVEMEFTSEFHQRRHVLHVGVPRSDAVRPATLQRGGVGVHDKFPEEAEEEGVACVAKTMFSLEVLEVDILWPRWVARIGVTRSNV